MDNFKIFIGLDYFNKHLNYLKFNLYFELQAMLKVNGIFLIVNKLHSHLNYQIHLIELAQHISKLKRIQVLKDHWQTCQNKKDSKLILKFHSTNQFSLKIIRLTKQELS